MNAFTGVVAFIIIWWVVLFAVLPIGVERDEARVAGGDPGAPRRPRLLFKAGLTTAISVVLWGIAYWLSLSDWLTFREP